ncbi:MAG: 1-deoxy-D-xylulose-5-phosphate synthase [Candidatus Eisenbacteria bacterium]|uniref:1-deoxy-D-xylulose-5-phosphate synthase n=1 Tax=Eiseniibacteriota bacterium TaxID=2212470 RepID=A0A538TQ91_UNCEI|nr:MAG: 1-deoxy-D-xylulose-5-phosphate synthase [Candidatus Eisenbacteria bacterium]
MTTHHLDSIRTPDDLKRLPPEALAELAEEMRERIVQVVSANGGHLAPSLGTVELTVALHSVFDTPRDILIWDVGHQSYGHKILTGRNDRFDTIRQENGLSGFPRRMESEYDPFGTAHASTAISAALGFACARDLKREQHKVIAVVGDGALTGGLAFEGLNQAGVVATDLLVVLNDNSMSISPNVGAIARYLTRITSAPVYRRLETDVWELLGKVPAGGKARTLVRRIKESMKNLVLPNILFEEFGFKYYGPIDGHDLPTLIEVLKQLKEIKGPVILHTLTRKGKGYKFAEEDARKYHGVSSFDKLTGTSAKKPSAPTYTEVYGQTLAELAAKDPTIVAITAAMPDGTGLAKFATAYPERFHDVGIAEQHGTCFSAGLAAAGAKPFATIYSTFLQRAYDQIIHDVAVQKLPVRFALDRAGLVGEDGATHHGVFDISYMRCLPGFVLMAPKDENEFRHMLATMSTYGEGPIAVRYPRGSGLGVPIDAEPRPLPIGVGELLEPGEDLVLVAYGTMVAAARSAARKLMESGIRAAVINARFAKPLDERLIGDWARRTGRIVTLEEGALPGGFGDAVLELLTRIGKPEIRARCFGVPDRFFDHGTRDSLLRHAGLDADSIAREVERWLKEEPRPQPESLAPVGTDA